jgi:hydrogenase maturation protease
MERATENHGAIVIAGFGSPHGDDQAGWRVVTLLEAHGGLPARVLAVYDVSQILHALDGCSTLVVVDACLSSGEPGTISRFIWPDPRVAEYHGNSTHSLGVPNVLRLAEALGRLPETVIVYGIEVEQCDPGRAISAEVTGAIAELEAIIAAEVGDARLAIPVLACSGSAGGSRA